MPSQCLNFGECFQIPYFDGLVKTPRGENFPFRTETQSGHCLLVAGQNRDFREGFQTPQLYRFVYASAGQNLAVRTHLNAPHRAAIVSQRNSLV